MFDAAASVSVPTQKRGIGYAFPNDSMLQQRSVLDNLYLGADGLLGSSVNREERTQRAAALMSELVGFDLDLDTPVGELPLSLKQWITIARALLTERKIEDGCHACPGYIGVYYLSEDSGKVRVVGRWPKAVSGWGSGAHSCESHPNGAPDQVANGP